ncbi:MULTISPECIES: NADPH-dependent F420 reductase [unclassified Sphingomonas]|uniref:NADPH-dependent F420 reductase n=1 Tax=unclassified Sphingomonas TaxID=196159 RepID=UPI000700F680|nr:MULTISPECIES: NADPH-dependent F420 reductase [unclassified Sphingomonas]KQX17648.1 F420-dependent NADP reductase [Sphingomonas sp. Root1294]KQY70574.1 F420-dependent NADP reductase [Sphingomonas sp. Root50]KRB91937.1 F420-dependent NADP reductase [Sphingomonas sp. Root720]
MADETKATIAVLGGTGKEGGGLALRWAHRGHAVIIGGRSAERARETAAAMNATLGGDRVSGADNVAAAAAAEIVVLAVPYAAQRDTVEAVRGGLAGKILIDVTVPLVPPKVSRVQLPEGGSAVEAVQHLLGEEVKVVSAFQNISAHHLTNLDEAIECDVLVCADDPAAADRVVALAEEIGLRAWNAGVLANSVVAEGLTSVLIALNRRYKVPGAGIRITGVPTA